MLTAALLGAAAAIAGPAAAEPFEGGNASRVAAARAMYDACGERKQIEVYFEHSAALVVARARVQTPTFSDAQWKAFQAIVAEDLKKGVDEYMAFSIASYAEHFTSEEIHAMTAYCGTPLGQKISAMRSQMETDTFEYRQAWMHAALLAALSDAQRKLQGGGNAL